jgi:hypothetical protein
MPDPSALPAEQGPSLDQLRAARNLKVDVATLEVVTALEAGGIPYLLLKGPAFARWLFDMGELRDYNDTDLMVSPDDVTRAEKILILHGFKLPEIYDESDRPSTEHTWERASDEAVVDLHWGITGMDKDPKELFDRLYSTHVRMDLRGREVSTLDPAAMALHVVLHAAQHGDELQKTLDDLERALARAPMELWVQTKDLAEELNAVTAFAAGLRLDPRGRKVAMELQLPSDVSVEVALRSEGAPPLALGLDWLSRQPLHRKFLLILKNLFPSPGFMRAWTPLARKGPGGLIAAYLWRPISLAKESVPAIKALLQARRTAKRK